MTTASKVLKIEKSYVRQTPYGPYNIFNSKNGLAWCGYFQKYCLSKAGADLKKWIDSCPNPAYVPTIWNWGKSQDRTSYHGKPGDLVIFDWNGNKAPDHVGMLIGTIKDRYGHTVYKTVEGNTSNISQGNGGCVQIRYREPRFVMGFVRPPYRSTSAKKKKSTSTVKKAYTGLLPSKIIKTGSRGDDVKRWQKFLVWYGYDLKVDGIFGAMTRRATLDFQKDHSIAADGIVGNYTIKKAKAVKR
jgi:hypothetical protein